MYLIIFLAAAATTLLLTPLVRRAALRLGVVDRPDLRKIHARSMPLLGGLAVAAGFAAGCAIAYASPGTRSFDAPFMGLITGAAMMVALGVYDDRFGADAKLKLTVQIFAATIVVASGSRIGILTNPLGGHWDLGALSIPISILWIVGVTNALNLIDGLDGLAAGIAAIVSLTLFAVAIPDPASFIPVAALALAGSCLGFLRYNFPPARIFLGDTGSLLLGFVIAVIGMQGFLKGAAALTLVVPLIAIGVPVLDTSLAILRRSARRKHLFQADREHLHHRLLRIGLSQRQAVSVLYWMSIFLALTALSLRELSPQKGVLLLGVACVAGGLLFQALGFVERRLGQIYARIRKLAEEGAAPGEDELRLLDGFHAAAQEGDGEAPAEGRETEDERRPAQVGIPELLGRPGTPRRILESKLPHRLRTP